jgi:glycosyltransferase involved in cell wall biosynthesis
VSVRALRSGDTIGDGRGSAVVVVAAAGSPVALSATLRQLAAHTDGRVPLVVACAQADVAEIAELDVGGDVVLLPLGEEHGVGAALRALHARAPHADVVVVGEGVLVGSGWLEGLREAAYADSIVMTASPLSEPGVDELALEALAGSVQSASLGVQPTISRAREDCCYLRAAALELVGPPSAQDAIAELSARISALGLVHILADGVCVSALADEDLLRGDSSALRRAVAVAQTSLRPLSVTVDARALGTAATGTRTYILDLIAAVAREESLRVRVLLPPDTAPEVLAVLEADAAIETIGYDEAVAGVPLTDVVHRPQQVFTADDLTLLRLVGERIVITHHDLIGYRCGDYHESSEQWHDYRRVTRLALAAADMVVFGSRHARDDALREDLIAAQRAHVVPHGAERVWPQPAAAEVRPPGVPADEALLVCIGVDYAHKNRPFALALAGALHERHAWNGRLVLAGPHVQRGSSRERERAMLEHDPTLAALVIDIGPVDDAARAWLYAHAQAVVYPSVYEGFGLVPFEAAQAGVPCLYAASSALGELAGPAAAALVAWDPDASAARRASDMCDCCGRRLPRRAGQRSSRCCGRSTPRRSRAPTGPARPASARSWSASPTSWRSRRRRRTTAPSRASSSRPTRTHNARTTPHSGRCRFCARASERSRSPPTAACSPARSDAGCCAWSPGRRFGGSCWRRSHSSAAPGRHSRLTPSRSRPDWLVPRPGLNDVAPVKAAVGRHDPSQRVEVRSKLRTVLVEALPGVPDCAEQLAGDAVGGR